MNIIIRNDRYETILKLHCEKNGTLTIEPVTSERKAYMIDIFADNNGEVTYKIELSMTEEILEQISTDDLLREVRRRMVTK